MSNNNNAKVTFLAQTDDFNYNPVDGNTTLPYVLLRDYPYDGIEFPEEIYDTSKNGSWRYLMIRLKGIPFYISLNYVGFLEQFILFLFMASDKTTASRYTYKMMLQEEGKENQDCQKRLFEKKVASIEEFARFEDIPDSKAIRLSQNEAAYFFTITKNDEDRYYTVNLPIELLSITEEE